MGVMSALMERFRGDACISPSHVSLFLALYVLFERNGCANPVRIDRSEVMALAKISGTTTYYRCIRQLACSGLIGYLPSRNKSGQSEMSIQHVLNA